MSFMMFDRKYGFALQVVVAAAGYAVDIFNNNATTEKLANKIHKLLPESAQATATQAEIDLVIEHTLGLFKATHSLFNK